MHALTVYLTPHSSMRGHSFPRSDTLFGALCWGIWLVFGKQRLDQLFKAYDDGHIPFLLSSMFTYTRDETGVTHYLPKPLGEPYTPATLSPEACRALQKLRQQQVVPDGTFTKMLNGHISENDLYHAWLHQPHQQHGHARPDLHVMPHAMLNRLTGLREYNQVFYATEIGLRAPHDQQTQGVFFCVKYHKAFFPEFAYELKTVLSVLADKGIGGGISSGNGQFETIEIVDGLPYQEPPDAESKHVLTLSLTYPDQGVRKIFPKSWYRLERRQGKLETMYTAPTTNHLWKDHLLMVQEGSTFPKNGQAHYGGLPIVRKAGDGFDFDVRQYGYAFTVNTKHAQGAAGTGK